MNCIQFIEDIEEDIFCKELIYRTVVITNNDIDKSIIEKCLTEKDYSVLSVDENALNIDFNNIDKRIVLINQSMFSEFIHHMEENNGGFANSSFNCIGISYDIDKSRIGEFLQTYSDKMKNSIIFMRK
jgi:hypothetical protein